ncbi:MAG: hypothetical protein FWE44_01390 [Defluviitaleaceae bacterium]|nr:hypothetical protein [Defluviitaleaceae bacterium]
MSEKKKISKGSVIIIAVIAVLLPIVVVLGVLHFRDMQERLTYHIEGSFRVVSGDEYRHISLDDMVNLSPVTFESTHRRAEGMLTGVPLATILDFSGIDYSQASSLAFVSYDGFLTAITMTEALDLEHTFIVFELDGLSLAENPGPEGNPALWAEAPFRLVLLNDMFPQRWARYVIEVVIQ